MDVGACIEGEGRGILVQGLILIVFCLFIYYGIEDQSILRLIRCLCVCVCVCGIVKINLHTIVGVQILRPEIDMK